MNKANLLKVILSPHVSEKSTRAVDQYNEYVFKVIKDASKIQIKAAIEFVFNTKVKAVRVLNVKPKQKTFKGNKGVRKGWKKAYITLEKGQKLEEKGVRP